MNLKPCPFCGKEVSRNNLWADGRGFYIECPVCRARGGSRTGTDESIAVWNRRAGGVCAFAEPTDLTDGCALLKERTCKRIDSPKDDEGRPNLPTCSKCGGELTYIEHYCPNCGAKVVKA